MHKNQTAIRDAAYILATGHTMTDEFTYDEFQKIHIPDHAWEPLEYMPEKEYASLVSGLGNDIARLVVKHSKSTIRETAKAILKEFKEKEDRNYHTENLLLLATHFGSPIEIQECQRSITATESDTAPPYEVAEWMRRHINTYYPILTSLAND
jgi:hypothetical protein